jgi:2-alkenal reductase
VLIAALLVVGLFFGFPFVAQRGIEIPRFGITQQPTGFFEQGSSAPTPTLIPEVAPPAQVGTPIIPKTGGTNPQFISSDFLRQLYQSVSPGVVSIDVLVNNAGQTGQAAGSGFVYDQAGHIVTNNHVVENANLVVVVFQDGSEAKANVVGTDPYSDLAVVKVEKLPDSATPLPLGDSSTVQTGDWVVAIGNPFGLSSSMSLGIVSAVGRTIPTGTSFSIPEAIQTDAAINPGNSGGPLLNMQGQVVGVNAQIASNGAMANSGVGFAIPVNTVRQVIPTLIDVGAYQWSWLGIEGTSVNTFIAQANNASVDRGAYIVHVVPGSPAEQAGLQGGDSLTTIDGVDVPTGGDIITQLDGKAINDYSELLTLIAEKKPGTSVTLTILRNGQQQQVNATLAPRPTQ